MKITCGIYLIKPNRTILICKATGGGWSIPKGLNEEAEPFEKTALRELYEETNVEIKPEHLYLIHLPDRIYKNKKKLLKSFVLYINDEPFDLKCNSYFGERNTPEVCEYKWATLNEASSLLHESQIENLSLLK